MRLLKTHFLNRSLIVKSQQNKIELVTRPAADQVSEAKRSVGKRHHRLQLGHWTALRIDLQDGAWPAEEKGLEAGAGEGGRGHWLCVHISGEASTRSCHWKRFATKCTSVLLYISAPKHQNLFTLGLVKNELGAVSESLGPPLSRTYPIMTIDQEVSMEHWACNSIKELT